MNGLICGFGVCHENIIIGQSQTVIVSQSDSTRGSSGNANKAGIFKLIVCNAESVGKYD